MIFELEVRKIELEGEEERKREGQLEWGGKKSV
jgi:hypothetical protein